MKPSSLNREPSPFEPGQRPAVHAAETSTPPASSAGLQNFVDTAAKVSAAKVLLDTAKAKQEAAVQAARDARSKAHQVEIKISTETQLLSAAQAELSSALMEDGKSIEKLQQRVNGIRLNIESLRDLHARLHQHADEMDAGLSRSYAPIIDAQQRLDLTEFDHLLATYAKAIAAAIPLAVEIRLRSHRLNVSMELSGLLLDPRRAQIGPYSVDADGNLFVNLR
jgi:hypothetical protein